MDTLKDKTGGALFSEYLASGCRETLMIPPERMPEADYHAEKRFVSKHILDLVADSPEKYKAAMDSEEVFETTPSMVLGSALHCAVLEPDSYEARFVVAPKFDRRTKAGKEAFAEWESQNAGKTVLTPDQATAVEGMRESIFRHKLLRALWTNNRGESEVTILSRDDDTGLALKARIDRVFPDLRIALDLKTCASAAPLDFARAVANFRYDVQASFYKDLLEKPTAHGEEWNFFFVAVENKAPYSVAVYGVSEWLMIGAASWRRDLNLLANCMATGIFPGYSVQDDELPMPKWLSAQRGF